MLWNPDHGARPIQIPWGIPTLPQSPLPTPWHRPFGVGSAQAWQHSRPHLHPGVTPRPCQTQAGQGRTASRWDGKKTQGNEDSGGTVPVPGAGQGMQPGLGGSPLFPRPFARGKWQEESIQCYGNRPQRRRKQSMAPCHL